MRAVRVVGRDRHEVGRPLQRGDRLRPPAEHRPVGLAVGDRDDAYGCRAFHVFRSMTPVIAREAPSWNLRTARETSRSYRPSSGPE